MILMTILYYMIINYVVVNLPNVCRSGSNLISDRIFLCICAFVVALFSFPFKKTSKTKSRHIEENFGPVNFRVIGFPNPKLFFF